MVYIVCKRCTVRESYGFLFLKIYWKGLLEKYSKSLSLQAHHAISAYQQIISPLAHHKAQAECSEYFFWEIMFPEVAEGRVHGSFENFWLICWFEAPGGTVCVFSPTERMILGRHPAASPKQFN